MKKILILALLALGMTACTDAERASLSAYGSEAVVNCYSGGQVVATYRSTGRVMQLDGDGIAFKNSATNRFVRAYADCIVEEQ